MAALMASAMDLPHLVFMPGSVTAYSRRSDPSNLALGESGLPPLRQRREVVNGAMLPLPNFQVSARHERVCQVCLGSLHSKGLDISEVLA